MTELYRNEGVVITECSSIKKHKLHTWRWGFLWLRKGICAGLTEDIVIERHRHHMFLSRWWTTASMMIFICDAHTAGCEYQCYIDRSYWEQMTLKKRN
jgi:hypothetical protein